MKKIDRKTFLESTKRYEKIFATGKPSKITTGVGFDSRDLLNWISSVAPHCTEIQVRFGIHHRNTGKSGENEPERVTVFFVPSDENGNPATDDNGNLIEPANAGKIYP